MSVIARNKKARFNYDIDEEFEAGVVLHGNEVKSIRRGRIDMTDSHAYIDDNMELWMLGVKVQKYEQSSRFIKKIDPERQKKLLLKSKEIKKLYGKVKQSGKTIVPLSVYFNSRNLVKVKVALCTGKKIYQKKQALKVRDLDRQIKKDLREK